MKSPMWIGDEYAEYSVGDCGFLVSTYNTNNRSESFKLHDHPPRTNISREPRLNGWCGETNNVSVNAHGFWTVVKVAKNGRAMIKRVEGEELKTALEEYGYPELVEDEENVA